jgi:cytochrome b pre-mRNA-processing protein 3
MPLKYFKKRRAEQSAAEALYDQAIAQSRRPEFYSRLGVPDTLDGRFDMIALHVFLVLNRLRNEGPAAKDLAQRVFDTMFADMDRNLRELGVGDLGVGPRVKTMAKALYGRIDAYEMGLACDDKVLGEALARNLFGTVEAAPEQLGVLCAYLREQAKILSTQVFSDFVAGKIRFGDAPSPSPDPGRQ